MPRTSAGCIASPNLTSTFNVTWQPLGRRLFALAVSKRFLFALAVSLNHVAALGLLDTGSVARAGS